MLWLDIGINLSVLICLFISIMDDMYHDCFFIYDVLAGSDHGSSLPRNETDGRSVTPPAIPAMQQKQDGQAKQTTSGSSREDSDDDDIEGETETNADPADAKRARR